MSTIFRVVDLTEPHPASETKSPLQAGAPGTVDLTRLRGQLQEIRDALTPVVSDQEGKGFHLDTMELDLTVGLEGQVWFIAKGKGEASLRLTWSKS